MPKRLVTKRILNSRTADKFVIRMPDGLRDKFRDLAAENHRSVNSEIIRRLEDSINPRYTWTPVVGMAIRLNGVPGVIADIKATTQGLVLYCNTGAGPEPLFFDNPLIQPLVI